MATTTFVDTVTPIVADWMNDADAVIYDALGDAFHIAPTTKEQVRINLGINTSGTAIQKADGTGGLTAAIANTDYLLPPAFTGVAAGSGGGALTPATGAQIVTAIGTTAVTNATNAVNLTGTSVANIKTTALGLNAADSTKVLYGDRTWRALPAVGVTSLNGLTGAVVFDIGMFPDYVAGELMEYPPIYLWNEYFYTNTPNPSVFISIDGTNDAATPGNVGVWKFPPKNSHPTSETVVMIRNGTVRITIDCLVVGYTSGTPAGVGLYQNGTLLQDFQFFAPGIQTNDIPVALGDTLYFETIDGSAPLNKLSSATCYITIANPSTMCALKPV